MSSVLQDASDLPPVAGIRLGTTCAGITQPDRRDLVAIELAEGTQTAAVFTRNAFCAAPVIVAKEYLAQTTPRYLLINTGNANAVTGEQGIQAARACCQAFAALAGCQPEQVLPFSTGVVGEAFPTERITAALPAVYKALDPQGWPEAAQGILTTDTVPKGASRKLVVQGKEITLTGIAKGSGMIRPDMATMLAYIATDADIEHEALQSCLEQAVTHSFNRITVDGDTSTNDACVLMATGQAGVKIATGSDDYAAFCHALQAVCESLAKAIVRDGEGATKLITVEVNGGQDEQECLTVAYTVAHSPLVKTAFFASDPNWGRILVAVGRAGVVDLDIKLISIFLDDVCIVESGGRAASYTEQQGQRVMDQTEITVRIELGRGNAKVQIWTCDLSYDYVRINAEYRT